MKTVTVLNERAKLIPVHDLSDVVAIYRVFYDDAACNVVVEEEQEEPKWKKTPNLISHASFKS